MIKKEELKKGIGEHIQTDRLEAFSDGVLAVIITIMVLELQPPHGQELKDILPLIPVFLAYVLSFAFIGIYWNNHHLLFRATNRITGGVMWANLHLLFWLSLIPFATAWVGEHYDSEWPAVFYGIIGFLAAIAYYVLTKQILKANAGTKIEDALADDTKGKVSAFLYLVGVTFAFINPLLSYVTYAIVSIMWFVPDRRLRKV